MLRYLVATSLALVALNHPALAKDASRARCPGGRFLAADAPLVTGDTAPESGAVVIAGGQVTVGGSCAATAVAVKRIRAGTLVRARWSSCSGLTGPVRLRALIRPGCATIVGVIRARHQHRRFVATRQPECGNDIREGHEQCDGGACCTADCQAVTADPSCPGDHACTTDDDCATRSASGAFCARRPGHCASAGVCASKDVVCTATVDPVCGCDGKTYSNACEAMQHGVNVAAPGACDAHRCGTIAGIGCDDGQVCELPPGECHVADAAGRCIDIPDVCLGILDPVCGCDGNTYVNDCYRLQAKVQKAHDGHCHCRDVMCSPGTKPIDTDGDGCPDTCVRPCHQTCDCYEDPTGGFSQQCLLDCATCGEFWTCEEGLCREHCGPVPPDNDQCRVPGFCTTNDQCAAGEYCACGLGMCDGPGICVGRPDVCTREAAPVCGCDGQTYPNACLAGAAGVRVEASGACECHDVECPDGSKGVDTDGDGCIDQCRKPCKDPCDCGPLPLTNHIDICPLAALCPAPFCGNFWTCDDGFCSERCGVVPPGTDVCPRPEGCASNEDCREHQVCFKLPGGCDGRGTCLARPGVCPGDPSTK